MKLGEPCSGIGFSRWVLSGILSGCLPLQATVSRGVWSENAVYVVLVGVLCYLVWQLRAIRRYLHQMKGLSADLRAKAHENELLQREIAELSTGDPTQRRGGSQFLSYLMAREENRIEREYNNWIAGRTFAPVNMDLIFMVLKLQSEKPFEDLESLNDALTLQTREIMRQCVRDSDLLIRWEGDGFLFVFRQANRDSAPFLAERLRWGLTQKPLPELNHQPLGLVCHIGFSCYPFVKKAPTLLGWEQVVSVAELALTMAQNQKKGWAGLYSTKNCAADPALAGQILSNTAHLIDQNQLQLLLPTQDLHVVGGEPSSEHA